VPLWFRLNHHPNASLSRMGFIHTRMIVYYDALKSAGVPAEMHVYAEGKHAFGLRPTQHPITTAWPRLVEEWLRTIRMID
jgi:acetyl esterase/lipase